MAKSFNAGTSLITFDIGTVDLVEAGVDLFWLFSKLDFFGKNKNITIDIKIAHKAGNKKAIRQSIFGVISLPAIISA